MHEFSLEFIRCVKCQKKLAIEVLIQNTEIEEGFLVCNICNGRYPIILKIPILFENLAGYFSSRQSLGGELLIKCKTKKMKSFMRDALSQVKKHTEDRTPIEKRWVRIYQNSKHSKFYSVLRQSLKNTSKQNLVLEHGCSIGLVSGFLAKKHKTVFGIDSSFPAIAQAKKYKHKNLDFFVADSLEPPFGKQKFGLIVALNLFEIIEPTKLLEVFSNEIDQGVLLLADPYDYDRAKSVKNPLDSKQIRTQLENLDFKISKNTKKPSHIPWTLNINKRARLQYKNDLIIAKR